MLDLLLSSSTHDSYDHNGLFRSANVNVSGIVAIYVVLSFKEDETPCSVSNVPGISSRTGTVLGVSSHSRAPTRAEAR